MNQPPADPADSELPDLEPLGLALAMESGYARARVDIGRFNLALFGPTGVGKSTLVNAVFGAHYATTGVGRPVTVGRHLYRSQDSSMGIVDTQGLEVGQHDKEILSDLRDLINEVRLRPLSDHIHVAWYCVAASSSRFQDSEADFVRQLSNLGLPVLLVVTQTPRVSGAIDRDALELAGHIESLRLPIWAGRVFMVNALADEWLGTSEFGLPELLDATNAAAPEGVRAALAAAQQVSRAAKRRQSEEIIAVAARQLQGKIILANVARVWAGMVAGISTIYGLPEPAAIGTVRTSQVMLRLRKILYVGRAGLVALGPTTMIITKVTAAVSKRRKPKPPSDEKAVVWAGHGSSRMRYRIVTGLTTGATTRAVGEAWLNTCEYYWLAAYPQQPVWDSEAFAERFTADLERRMPRGMRIPQRRRHPRKQ